MVACRLRGDFRPTGPAEGLRQEAGRHAIDVASFCVEKPEFTDAGEEGG